MTYTRAERRGNDRWVISGRKHFITGAGEASTSSSWPAPARMTAPG